MKFAAGDRPGSRPEGLQPFHTANSTAAPSTSDFALPCPRRHLGFALWIFGTIVCFGQSNTPVKSPVPSPEFSVPGGIRPQPFEVKLQAPSAPPESVIRYTLDGSDPTQQSALYTSPLSVTRSVRVKARTFSPGAGASPTVSQSYTLLAADFQPFNSSLPLIVVNTFGQPVPHLTKVPGSFQILEPAGGANSVTGKPTWQGRVEINRRGNTSRQFPKHSYTLKLTDDSGQSSKVPLAGLPADSDWVLYAPYFDRTQLRDVLAYELSNQLGRYAPRTRFVEVFVAGPTGRMGNRDYVGTYVLAEKIKRGRNRVNLDATEAGEASGETPGGYLFKKDHVDPGEIGFRTGRGLHFLYVYPKERDITGEQRTRLVNYLNQFERTLHGRNFADPNEGYAKFLDVDAFIDHFWLVEMSKNVDGFRFSAFLQLSPAGKLKMGPTWDWDQSFGNANFYGGDSPEGWYWPHIRETEIDWFDQLRKDPQFQQRYIKRWFELRRGPFATAQLLRRIDALVATLGEAQQRNSNRWPTRRDYLDYIRTMKRWIQRRVDWIDRELAPAPGEGSKEVPDSPK